LCNDLLNWDPSELDAEAAGIWMGSKELHDSETDNNQTQKSVYQSSSNSENCNQSVPRTSSPYLLSSSSPSSLSPTTPPYYHPPPSGSPISVNSITAPPFITSQPNYSDENNPDTSLQMNSSQKYSGLQNPKQGRNKPHLTITVPSTEDITSIKVR